MADQLIMMKNQPPYVDMSIFSLPTLGGILLRAFKKPSGLYDPLTRAEIYTGVGHPEDFPMVGDDNLGLLALTAEEAYADGVNATIFQEGILLIEAGRDMYLVEALPRSRRRGKHELNVLVEEYGELIKRPIKILGKDSKRSFKGSFSDDNIDGSDVDSGWEDLKSSLSSSSSELEQVRKSGSGVIYPHYTDSQKVGSLQANAELLNVFGLPADPHPADVASGSAWPRPCGVNLLKMAKRNTSEVRAAISWLVSLFLCN